VLDHGFDPVHSWVENVTVESKAVRCAIRERRDSSSKAIQVDHFVRIVELKNVAHTFNRLQVLVTFWIEIMQRAWLVRVAI